MADVLALLRSKGETEYFSPSYPELLEASGLTVERCEYFGSYQGDAIAIVSDGQRQGIAIWGYGSCSGCDHLQAITPWGEDADWQPVNDYADEMRAGVHWPEDDAGVSGLARHILANATDWYIYDEKMKRWLEILASGALPEED